MIYTLKIIVIICISIVLFNCNNRPPTKNQRSNNHNLKEKNCITQVIAIDDSIGKIRNHNCETISLSETIRMYTSGIDKVDFTNCPPNFKQAFHSHKEAWTKMTTITNNYPDLRGEMHDLFKILEEGEDKEAFKILLGSIWSTWEDVENSMGN